jgi:hypothetical protein
LIESEFTASFAAGIRILALHAYEMTSNFKLENFCDIAQKSLAALEKDRMSIHLICRPVML